MALSAKSVNKAITILRKVDKTLPAGIVYDRGSINKQPRVFGRDRKSDGGWESVYIYVNNITESQLSIFNSQKGNIPNTSFIRDIGDGITKIGWF